MQYVVIYHDPKRDQGGGANHTVHAAGCADIARAVQRSTNGLTSTDDLQATDLDAALIEAQYQGLEPSDAADLGAVDPAPCTKRKP